MSPASEALITFWGTRGSISTPGRITEKYGGNTLCVGVRHKDTHIILDAGTGIRNLGLELTEQCSTKGLSLHLFLSHTHWESYPGAALLSACLHKRHRPDHLWKPPERALSGLYPQRAHGL